MVGELFAAVDRGDRRIVTSSLTLLELLVLPYRTDNRALIERYEAFLTHSRGYTSPLSLRPFFALQHAFERRPA